MSSRRPTEISWDSDEDEELLSINTKFKADDDEELDEDALLESDDESSPIPSKPQTSVTENKKSLTTNNKPIKSLNSSVINKVPNKTTSSRNGAPSDNVSTKKTGNAGSGANSAKQKINPIVFSDPEPEPVLILEDPEEDFEFDDSGVTEAILDSSQGEEPENFKFTKPFEVGSKSISHTTHVSVNQREEEGMEDQSDVSNLEVSVDRGQESSDESEESDHEDDRRGRFRTERQQTVKLTNHKPVGDIPDTLEISKEQEEEIEQFNKSHNKSHRGRGRGRGGMSGRGGYLGGSQGRRGFSNRGFPNRNGPQRRDMDQRVPPTNHNFQHNHYPTSFPQELPPPLIQPQQSLPPPASVPQKIHINPHFRRGSMLPPRQGDGIMATPGIPPLLRPREPSMMLQPRAPIVQSVPQSVSWTSQSSPQPIFSRPPHQLPPHQMQDPPPHHHYAAHQPPPRQNDPYPAYSGGPPSHAHQAPHHYVGPHHHQAPHGGPPPFHGQQYPPREQYRPSGPPPQPLMGQPNHQFPAPHHPPQPQVRVEPQHPPHVRMGPPPHQPNSGPPPQHQHYNPQPYQEHRYPNPQRAPEQHVRPDFHPPHQTQQQPPRFQLRGAPGYQSQPPRFQSQGQRMPQGPNTVQNNGAPRQPVNNPKQNALLMAHAKKLRDRAKKFSQNTPIVVPSKPKKRPSTEVIVEGSIEPSPVKQTKVETKPLTPEDKELQEKLALQAEQREYIRRKKEANRQAIAQKKREELAQRLAGTGQTLEDIEQSSTTSGPVQQQVHNKPVQGNVALKKTIQPINTPQAGQQIQTVQSNQIRFQNTQVSQPPQRNPQKKIVNLNKGVHKPANAQMTTNKTLTSPTKKLMKRIETVKKNAQGEIISREIKLVPIEDEGVISEQTSVTNRGQVQVVKKSTMVTSTGGQLAGNRTVVSGNRSVITPGSGNRSVIRLTPDSGQGDEGDLRNVVSQQTTGRRIVVKSTPKSVMVKNLSISTSDSIIKNLCTTVGPVESIKRDQKDAVVTFMNANHASLFAEKYNRTLLDLSTILVSLMNY